MAATRDLVALSGSVSDTDCLRCRIIFPAGDITRAGRERQPQVCAAPAQNCEMNSFDWNDLRYFLAVARTGSTIAAAKDLGVNQSTVQRRLAALEEAIGRELVERLPVGYRLTSFGEELRPHAEQVETAIACLDRKIASSDTSPSGT